MTAARGGTQGRLLLVVALGLLAVLVILEVAAGPALTPVHDVRHEAQVVALPGVPAMVHGTAIPAELHQVAASQRQPAPLAIPSQALLDGLLLVSGAALAWPRRRTGHRRAGQAVPLASGAGGAVPVASGAGGAVPVASGAGRPARSTGAVPLASVAGRPARSASFLGSLAVLLAGIAVAVVAISRLRFLVALYLSPPLGTLSYLLLYGSSERRAVLVVLAVVMALKLAAVGLFARGLPRVGRERGLAGLALTSVAATVLATFGAALAPTSLASIVDAMVAAIAALAAVLWAGVIVSGSVRRLA